MREEDDAKTDSACSWGRASTEGMNVDTAGIADGVSANKKVYPYTFCVFIIHLLFKYIIC